MATVLLAPLALLAILAQDVLAPFARRVGRSTADWPLLGPLRRWIMQLPAAAALPLFLVPEIFSRLGTLLSAWLLLHGDIWRALAVYAAARLIAGVTAIWIYTACLPALLQIKAFATIHAGVHTLRRSMMATARARLPTGGRFAAVLSSLRDRLAIGSRVQPP